MHYDPESALGDRPFGDRFGSVAKADPTVISEQRELIPYRTPIVPEGTRGRVTPIRIRLSLLPLPESPRRGRTFLAAYNPRIAGKHHLGWQEVLLAS